MLEQDLYQPDEGDLSVFQEGLADVDMSVLDDPNPGESEGSIILEVLAQLQAEHGIEFAIAFSGDLTAPFALNHRLDAVVARAGGRISNETLLDIQSNDITHEQANEIFLALVNEEALAEKTQEELEEFLSVINRLIEIIVADPQHLFIQNIRSQSLLHRVLEKAATTVQEWISTFSQREMEIIDVKSEIITALEKMRMNIQNCTDLIPNAPEIFEPVIQIIQDEVEKLPDNTLELSGIVRQVTTALKQVAQIHLGKVPKLVVDPEKLADVLLLISRMK